MQKELRIKILKERTNAKMLRKLYGSVELDKSQNIKKIHDEHDKKVAFLENMLLVLK